MLSAELFLPHVQFVLLQSCSFLMFKLSCCRAVPSSCPPTAWAPAPFPAQFTHPSFVSKPPAVTDLRFLENTTYRVISQVTPNPGVKQENKGMDNLLAPVCTMCALPSPLPTCSTAPHTGTARQDITTHNHTPSPLPLLLSQHNY